MVTEVVVAVVIVQGGFKKGLMGGNSGIMLPSSDNRLQLQLTVSPQLDLRKVAKIYIKKRLHEKKKEETFIFNILCAT